MEKGVVALLPMKAHSERITAKNFRDFAGRPLFRWVLDTLMSIKMINKIIINTDARHILAQHGIVSNHQILIRDRPSQLCGGEVSMNRIIENDVENVKADIYLMTHTTNPLMSSGTIISALEKYIEVMDSKTHDSLFSVDEIQTRFYRAGGDPINHDPDNLIRTQDLEKWYEENSNLYIFSRNSFASTNARIGKTPFLFVSPKFESIDIDTQDDWDFAVNAARHLSQKNNG
tara:strand:- start:206 stop:898 length:693 start_codon:yes stop_codon:yes gene_type:complete